MLKYKVFWGNIEFRWPFSQWVRPRCPNEPPGLLNTLKVFHLSIDIAVIRCVACAEIANLSKKNLKKVTSLVPAVKIMKKKPSNPPKSWARQTLEKSGRSNSSPSWTNSLVGTGSFFVSTWFRMLFQEPLCLNSLQSSELLLTLKVVKVSSVFIYAR